MDQVGWETISKPIERIDIHFFEVGYNFPMAGTETSGAVLSL
jgi:hypothetical protein